MEPRAPDDIRDVQHAAILQQWESVSHADDSRGALDPRRSQIRRFDADEWRSAREYDWSGFPPDGRVQRQYAVEQHPEHQAHEEDATRDPLDTERNVSGIWPHYW